MSARDSCIGSNHGIHTTLSVTTVLSTAGLGIAAVAAAPLFTIRRLRRMAIPDTLRVQE